MTAPNIEAIAASLRSCSLGGSAEAPEQQQLPAAGDRRPSVEEKSGENVGVTVELNSEVALPYHWEQCLDMRTGEVYYINWKDGTRTSVDPRLTTTLCSLNISEDDGVEAEEDDEEEDDDDYCDGDDSSSSVGDGTDCDDFYGVKTSSSSGVGSAPSSEESQTADVAAAEHVLVAAGCKSCFMYFMVSKRVEACPKCGGCLLHLGRNGYF
ncbi:hypothetical protein KSP40_PGU003733 [Platanthera guangdongensis]|uniref:WW domain-containing protein n=1 Tax=Platanthera guangdongensis TaxID=2320717 RepID=A0ABR2N0I3_9ASPA